MKLLTIALALSALQLAAAHTIFTTLFVNGVDQGDGTCVRMNMTPDNCTFPVNDLASNDMACGYDGTIGVARVCQVSQNSTLTFLWREWADASQPGSIDSSHKGPCAVYMKAVSSAITDTGYGTGWFKIWDSAYDSVSSQWCTEKLIQNNGLLSVDIPDDIAGGYYLVRPELLALQQADTSPPNPQFYIGCAQIFLQSTGTAVPNDTVSIPGYVHAGDASVDFNIYTPQWPYPIPGPASYKTDSSTNGNAKVGVASAQVQEEGLVPDGCVLSNANWCGMELDTYSTEAGCWNASTACFQQDTLCYSSSPPTGSKNCPIWEAKCDGIQAACNAGKFDGPPDQGKDLNPIAAASYSIPSAAAENSGEYSITFSPLILATTSSLTSAQVPVYMPDAIAPIPLITDTFSQSSSGSLILASVASYTSSEPFSNITSTSMAITSSISGPSSSSSSISTTTSSSIDTPVASPNTTLPISIDATCGLTSNHTCLGSAFGSCCSQWNWCGITDAYCGQGCQTGYGTCEEPLNSTEKRSTHLKIHRGH